MVWIANSVFTGYIIPSKGGDTIEEPCYQNGIGCFLHGDKFYLGKFTHITSSETKVYKAVISPVEASALQLSKEELQKLREEWEGYGKKFPKDVPISVRIFSGSF